MLKKIKSKFIIPVMCAVTSAALAVSASAETVGAGLSTANVQEIQAQFTGMAESVIPLIVGVLGAGLTIFAIFQGIRLAKKMFSSVSRG